MTAIDPLDFLFSLERLGMKFGLENMTRLCEALGHPERRFTPVLVGGTNGKGSVTAMVDTGLRAAGHSVARYTSPHLIRLEERFVIGGREVATDRLRAAAARVQAAAERLTASGVLESLPKLPDNIEYRFVGKHLILRDMRANLVIDYILNAIP